MVYDDSSSGLLSELYIRKLFFGFYSFCDETPGIGLDEHKLKDIDLLVGYPSVIKFLKVFTHVFQNILNGYIDLFHNSFVDVSDYLLYHFELLE